MSRLTTILVLAVGVLAGGLGATLLSAPKLDEAAARAIAEKVVAEAKPEPGLTASAVETIVADLIARQPKQDMPQPVAALEQSTLDPMIENYLMGNPRILQKVTAALDAELTAERTAATRTAMVELKPAIFESKNGIVLGNPNGDVTLVEMFDYNCGYCRQALPDLAALLDSDKNLKVILKEFPILSQGSVDAARVAAQVADADVDYWTFHEALFTGRGQVDKAAALKAAADLGLNPISLEMGMKTPRVDAVIEESYRIADRLKITGTPTFIIGNEIIPGAIGLEALQQRIANMRACGATVCTTADQPG